MTVPSPAKVFFYTLGMFVGLCYYVVYGPFIVLLILAGGFYESVCLHFGRGRSIYRTTQIQSALDRAMKQARKSTKRPCPDRSELP